MNPHFICILLISIQKTVFFGTSPIEDEKLIFKEGTLSKCLNQGIIFIVDEFNNSSEYCMISICSTFFRIKFLLNN